MRRILIIVGELGLGGAENFIMNLYRTIDKEKIQFDFVCYQSKRNCFEDEIIKMGGKIYYAPRFGLKNYFKYKKWFNLFFAEHKQYKIVHVHIHTLAPIIMKIARSFGATTIVHCHSAWADKGLKGWFVKASKNYSKKYGDYWFACSLKAGIWYYGKKFIQDKRFEFVPNGIDLQKFYFDIDNREKHRDMLGVQNDELLIGHIGRFAEAKNHLFLIDVFNLLQQSHPKIKLLLVGDGTANLEKTKQKCKNLGLESKIIFAGGCMNVDELYSAMDIFVLPSLYEGFPLTMIEAQANGLKCYVSDRITNETDLSNCVTYLPIDSAKHWESILINNNSRVPNEIICKNPKLQAFDIREIAKKLTEFYGSLEVEND